MSSYFELYKKLDEKISSSLSMSWDNDGMMVCENKHASVKRVLLSLDVNNKAVSYAIENGFDLIVSHHPLIFKPVKALNEDIFTSEKAIKLLKNNISVFSFHTRLDALCGGVNDALADKLGVVNTQPFGEVCEELGRIGELSAPMTLEDFAGFVKDTLGCEKLTYVGEASKKVNKVALLGGDGKDFLTAAHTSDADVYVTGSMSYNSMLDAFDMGMSVIEAGHFESENPVLEILEKMIKEFDNSIYTEIFNSNCIITI